jgi:hypothetical protein
MLIERKKPRSGTRAELANGLSLRRCRRRTVLEGLYNFADEHQAAGSIGLR